MSRMDRNCINTVDQWLSIFSSWIIVFMMITSVGCGSKDKSLKVEKLTGEELSKEFCTSCHLYTEPSLLPKEQWKIVLDRMALHLGISSGVDPYKGKILEEIFLIQQANVFASEPAMSDSAWSKLVAFYIDQAPDSLPSLKIAERHKAALFKESFAPLNLGGFPVITMIEYDDQNEKLYVANLHNQLVRLNNQFIQDQITGFLAPVVDVTSTDDGNLLVTEIGFLDNNDQKAGLIEKTDKKSLAGRTSVMIELIRPVHLETGDIDGDGIKDLVVCSFGNLVGDLSWYKYENKTYSKNLIRDTPGAIQTRLMDTDGDGDLDIIALFGQAQEGVSLFVNDGGSFREEKLLEFHPLFGCSSMEVIDFDGDGDLDIIVSNGDNGDYSFVPKPYHGVRIFENLGNWRLEERLFIPMYGATGIICRDFDQDGDLDLFVYAFYPDFINGISASLLYLENRGNYEFIHQQFDLASAGRWLVADAGDLDQDGDIDIFVGSFALGPGIIPDSITSHWRSASNSLLYLENQLITQ